ncbi:MAG: hypothetical protein ACTSQS_19125, partial [Promethearchaeota archaeon]
PLTKQQQHLKLLEGVLEERTRRRMEPERIQAEEADQLKREEEKNVQMAILASYNTGKETKD